MKRARRIAAIYGAIATSANTNKFRKHRSEEHTSELQSRGLISYAVFCLKKKKKKQNKKKKKKDTKIPDELRGKTTINVKPTVDIL